MHGWRGRLGFVVPSNNTVLEPELYGALPAGVTAHFARVLSTGMGDDELLAMSAGAAQAFVELAAGGMDFLGYACLSTSAARGDSWDDELTRDVHVQTSVCCETAARATIAAARALGAARIGLVSPYPHGLHARLLGALAAAGLDVVGDVTMAIDDPLEVCRQDPGHVYRLGRSVGAGRADAVVVVATDLQTFEIIEPLERTLGRPVVTTNQALLWAGLRAAGEPEPLAGLGRLLADPALREPTRSPTPLGVSA